MDINLASIDRAALTGEFARTGRARIADFLPDDSARQLFEGLKARGDWSQVVNSDRKVIELGRDTRADMATEQADALDRAVYAGARYGFQHRYESIRVSDDRAARVASDDSLADFALTLSEGPVRELLRDICVRPAIDFADAQATAYSPGDFLTGHDDAVAGKNRLVAYVYSLCPRWRAEWGGLLLFHDGNGERVEGLIPGFNVLNLFAVPQMHSVSEVSRAAPVRRYSITGWLRAAP